MQVDLPDDVFNAIEELDLSASEMLEEAVRVHMQLHQDALVECDRYLSELWAEVGEPTAEEIAFAEEASRIVRRAELRPLEEPAPSAPLELRLADAEPSLSR